MTTSKVASTAQGPPALSAAEAASTEPCGGSLEALFQFRGPEEVRRFLAEHPFLIPLLAEAHGVFRKHFPSSAVRLEVVVDAEDAADSQLIAWVAVEGDPAHIFKQIQEIDQEWWLAALDRAQSKFHFNVEFQ